MSGSSRPIPRPRSCPLAIPTNRDPAGLAQRCGRALVKLKKVVVLVDSALAQVETIPGQSKNTTCLPRARQSDRC